jgi:hypothetical protein
MHPRKQKILDIYGKEPSTLNELGECTIAVINASVSTPNFHSRKSFCPVNVIGFRWEVRWGESVSNSHQCPLSGVTNWGNRDSNAPTGYPGWSGRVWIRYDKEPDTFGSDLFRNTLTYTGTGGYGSYDGPWTYLSTIHYRKNGHSKRIEKRPSIYSWDYRFYEDDWPLVAEFVEQRRNWAALQDKPYERSHTFMWQDEATVEADKEYIEMLTGEQE